MGIKNFVRQWREVSGERADTHKFWLTLIRDVFNIDKPKNFIKFEEPVKLAHKNFIDIYFPDSKVIVEQKSPRINLDAAEAFNQAKRYNDALEYSRRARWIITCNFREFLIYDMETLEPPTKILLEELPEKYHLLDFLIDPAKNKLRLELELSLQAGEIVAKIYDALLGQYVNPNSPESLESLNKLCVRLVFCLYAESSGIFSEHKIFRDYLAGARNIRRDLMDLFEVLNTPLDERNPYLDDTLKKFPYVNGGLFDGAIEIPNFTTEIKNLLLEEASSGFNWSGISPTIFGAVFESTLNPETRRAGGMHYTRIENIHKVIDPLFMENLRGELSKLRTRKKLLEFQNKLTAIKVFDPACGSGNFLTESYLSLRRLENELLKKLLGSQIRLGELENPIKISIGQFYGIEINDFAVAVAQTALWIAELQMMQETQEIIHRDLDFLPIKSHANIHKANALRVDWREICPPDINYIIGNPPFVGTAYQSPAQKADIFVLDKRLKPLDYVTGWYFKANEFMRNNSTRAAFVSTNSITQGEQVGQLWKILDSHIDFAHRTFKWESESKDKAAVHCVIIGTSCTPNDKPKKIFNGKDCIIAQNINGYLLDAPDIYLEKRKKPLRENVPIMIKGSMPNDGGNLILSAGEYESLLKSCPELSLYIKRYMGSDDLINGKIRYCLYLKNCPPHLMHSSREVMRRLNAVKESRLASKRAATRKWADSPQLFTEDRQPDSDYLVIPVISSEKRFYVPMNYATKDIIANANVQMIPRAQIYHFGILNSSIHMGWMRAVCGRLEMRYNYSATIVYNNFVWCEPSDKQRALIEKTAQSILDVRARYPDSTLADLYEPLTMPRDLREAHRANDKAVAQAYGFENILDNETKIVAELFKMYEALTKDEH